MHPFINLQLQYKPAYQAFFKKWDDTLCFGFTQVQLSFSVLSTSRNGYYTGYLPAIGDKISQHLSLKDIPRNLPKLFTSKSGNEA